MMAHKFRLICSRIDLKYLICISGKAECQSTWILQSGSFILRLNGELPRGKNFNSAFAGAALIWSLEKSHDWIRNPAVRLLRYNNSS